MLSIQKISKAAAKGYAEYIAEQEEEAMVLMADNPSMGREEAQRQAARKIVKRVAERDGEDVSEALRQFDARRDIEQVGAQVGYYALSEDSVKEGDRLVHIAGDKVGEKATAGELKEMLLMRDEHGRRLDDAHPKQVRALAQACGIDREPSAEELDWIRAGFDPMTGNKFKGAQAKLYERAWASKERRENAVTGVDMTFSAPKSVSIYAAAAAANGEQEKYEKVLECVQEAVTATLDQAQREGLICARRGKDGADRIAAKLTDSIVKLETGSRARDPQVHAHTVTSSVVEGEDGRRTQLDAQVIFNSSKYLGVSFRRHLSQGLQKELGLQMKVDELGMHELVGFDEELISKYSTRSSEIAETLSEMDAADEALRNAIAVDRDAHKAAFDKQQLGEKLTPTEAKKAKNYGKFLKLENQTQAGRRQEATLQSRRGKDGSESELIEDWKKDADLSKALLREVEARSKEHQVAEATRAVFGSHSELTEEQLPEYVGKYLTEAVGEQTFSEKDARIAFAQFAPSSWDSQKVNEEVEKFLQSPEHIVRIQRDEMVGPKLASWTHDVNRYSTPAVVERQERIKRNFGTLAKSQRPKEFDFAHLAELAESYTLTAEQMDFNAAITATNLTIAKGYAGTGKSHTLKPAVEILQNQGYEVSIFCAKKRDSYKLALETGANRGESVAKLVLRPGDNGEEKVGLLETNKWAQGESAEVRDQRRVLERKVREAGNRARRAEADGLPTQQKEAEAEQAKAQVELDKFNEKHAQTMTASEISDEWDKALEDLEKAKRMPRGRRRQKTMERLAKERAVLSEMAGISSDSKVEIDWDTKHCFVIDEAWLLTDEQLDRIAQVAVERNIKLVLLGDNQQGRAIGVSGAYAELEQEYGSISLTEVQRAKAEWEKDLQVKFHDLPREAALEDAGAKAIVNEYEEHERIDYITERDVNIAVASGKYDADDKGIARKLGAEAAAQWYMDNRAEDQTACVQTQTLREQVAVSDAIQKQLIERGELKEKAKTASLPLDKNTVQQGRVGEPILIRKNLQNGLQNGMTGEIAAIHRDGSIKVRVQDGHRTRVQTITKYELHDLNAVSLQYASTIRKAQGATFDRTAVVAPADGSPMEKGDLYTAMTRGKYENRAIVTTSGSEEKARDYLTRSMKNHQEDEALTIDYINAPLTPEEIAEEKAFGTHPNQIEAMVRASREARYQLRAERKAQARADRQRAESAAAERLRAERKVAEEKRRKREGHQHVRSRVRMR